MSLYNRALSSNEIAAIYLAGSAGKCFTPTAPTITTQPTNQTVVVGQTASFSVTTSGTPPLSYQWTFDTTNIVAATNATLVLTNVQLTNAGIYAVVVSNPAGSVLSSNATLTVNPPPPCDPAAIGDGERGGRRRGMRTTSLAGTTGLWRMGRALPMAK